jgi:hypothetical protein
VGKGNEHGTEKERIPNWSESYGIHKDDEVEDKTNQLQMIFVDRKQKGTTKIPESSFGPTFVEAEHTEVGPENSLGPENNPKNFSTKSKKRKVTE